MQSFQWDKNFETGLDEVDEQHHHLVNLLNKYNALTARQNFSAEDAKKLLVELAEYSSYHFHEEEQLMLESGIAREHMKEHFAAHHKFVTDIKDLSHSPELDREGEGGPLLTFMVNWLVYHILGADQNMARQIKAIQKGVDPEVAYHDEERDHDEAVGPLLESLKRMFEQVSDKNKELMLLNQSLEEKVAQRTKELMEVNVKLEKLSLTDALTELPNRRSAMLEIGEKWDYANEYSAPLACMLIDVDLFKQVNDTAGHDAGDDLLKTLSSTLINSYREEDTVCRLGGDEFLVICPNINLKQARELAESVLSRVQKIEKQYESYTWKGSISVGVAEKRDSMTTSGDLIKAADESVYVAKDAGKNCVRSIQSL